MEFASEFYSYQNLWWWGMGLFSVCNSRGHPGIVTIRTCKTHSHLSCCEDPWHSGGHRVDWKEGHFKSYKLKSPLWPQCNNQTCVWSSSNPITPRDLTWGRIRKLSSSLYMGRCGRPKGMVTTAI